MQLDTPYDAYHMVKTLLNKYRGKIWNDIYSLLIRNHKEGFHRYLIEMAIQCYVEFNIVMIDGIPYSIPDYGPIRGYYVWPKPRDGGRLYYYHYKRKPFKRPRRKDIIIDDNGFTNYELRDGIWYSITWIIGDINEAPYSYYYQISNYKKVGSNYFFPKYYQLNKKELNKLYDNYPYLIRHNEEENR